MLHLDRAIADSLCACAYRTPRRKYYLPSAILASEEQSAIFIMLLENLTNVSFTFALEDPDLDDLYYWRIVKYD